MRSYVRLLLRYWRSPSACFAAFSGCLGPSATRIPRLGFRGKPAAPPLTLPLQSSHASSRAGASPSGSNVIRTKRSGLKIRGEDEPVSRCYNGMHPTANSAASCARTCRNRECARGSRALMARKL